MTYASKIEDLIAERDKLRAVLESLRRDAERYRWLRDRHDKAGAVFLSALDDNGYPQKLDAAIDAAMTGETR